MEYKIPEKYTDYSLNTVGAGARGNIQVAYNELKK
jgi:hypothetical protein